MRFFFFVFIFIYVKIQYNVFYLSFLTTVTCTNVPHDTNYIYIYNIYTTFILHIQNVLIKWYILYSQRADFIF